MEDVVVYNFISTVINNGVKNGLSVNKVDKGISSFMNYLTEQGVLLSNEITNTVKRIRERLNQIMLGEITLESIYSLEKSKLAETNNIKKVKVYKKTIQYSACGSPSNYGRCGMPSSSGCGSSRRDRGSNRCGMPSSSGCGSSRSGGRC